jgi:peptidyl-tRNA hydrolase, PTH1 family
LVVGLGNPGARYARTRHSVGFKIVDRIAQTLGASIEKAKFESLWGESRLDSDKVLLVKPQTFMNLSGRSVRRWISYYHIPLNSTIIVHDDLDLNLGHIKFGHGGGAGGHKGIESIVREVGSSDIPRLKIGIGRPRYGEPIEDFVLSSFYSGEQEDVGELVARAAVAVETWIREGISMAMNKFN